MFFAEPYSEAGRATHTQLNSLRRQLGLGVDPAFDYSQMEEAQQKLVKRIQAKKRGETTSNDKRRDYGMSAAQSTPAAAAAPISGLEQLRRALRGVAGAGDTAVDVNDEGARSPNGLRANPSSPSEGIAARDRLRPSPAFLAPGRDSSENEDQRAPRPGTYRPNDAWMRPRYPTVEFGERQQTKSLRQMHLENELERLKAARLPCDHLLKEGVSVESEEGIPKDKMKQHVPDIKLGKMTSRPNLVKASRISYNTNSFTDGVLDGHLHCSNSKRSPSWDIAKGTTVVVKPVESYYQPGQYKINDAVVRPRLERLNVAFEKQSSRKPLAIGQSSSLGHLPDRSLSRKSGRTQESKPKLVIDFDKYTVRPSEAMVIEYHDKTNPVVDQEVMRRNLNFDADRAYKAVQTRARQCESFDKALTRQQHAASMRHSGPEALRTTKDEDGIAAGDLGPSRPHSAEALVTGRVQSPVARSSQAPSRRRDFSRASRFERNVREGDSKAPVAMSQLSNTIAYFRATRSYEAIAHNEYSAD